MKKKKTQEPQKEVVLRFNDEAKTVITTTEKHAEAAKAKFEAHINRLVKIVH